jgi:hypothetical protein
MIVQTIHEILNPFDVETPLGYGVAIFMIAGSIHSNPQFIIRLYDTGDIRTVDQNDVKIYGNPTTGEPLTPQKQEFPSNQKIIQGLKNHFKPINSQTNEKTDHETT